MNIGIYVITKIKHTILRQPAAGLTADFSKNMFYSFRRYNDDDNMDVEVCIFRVPISLSASNPEAYVPQLVGLGPYNHLRPEVQHMQTYKFGEVEKLCKAFGDMPLKELVRLLNTIVMQPVRASYETYLNMNDWSLACVIAIDGLFLFELLCCYGISTADLVQSEILSQLVKSAGRRLAQETALRDAMLLENQIPIFALKVILIILTYSQSSGSRDDESHSNSVVGEFLPQMLLGFCKAVSPLRVLSDYPRFKVLKHSHLMDLLYHLITLNVSPEKNSEGECSEAKFIHEISEKVKKKSHPKPKPTYAAAKLHEAKKEESKKERPKMDESKNYEMALEVIGDLVPRELNKPVKLIQGLLGLPLPQLLSNVTSAVNQAPFLEEILIPKASELHKAGITFEPASHITLIRFDLNTLSFHLPCIKIDINSEVVLRNLVAYENMIKLASDSLILTRYMELMSGLIVSREDVNVLKGIVQSESMKDEDIAKLFSGMIKSVRTTNTPDLDKAIADVNKFYNGLWKVSAMKFIKKWRGPAWSYCKVLAAFLFLLLMAIQAFCSVYECHRLSFKSNTSWAQQGIPSLRSYM